MMRSLVISVVLLSVGAQIRGGVIMNGDVFNGASKGGTGSVASVSLTFSPPGSVCLRGGGWMDFTPVFTPEMEGLTIDESMLSGFTLNSDGTLRLSLDGESSAVGSVSITESNLSWGAIYAQASIHRCQGDQHERCCACGRRHGWGIDDHCSHEPGCAALTDFPAPCTCQPLFLRVNWNDDDGDGEEDRYADAPVDGEDDFKCFRSIGDSHSCWCGCDEAEQVSVFGLTASSELRLWCGSSPANDGAAGFWVEAIGATSGIGTGSIQYDIYDSTNGLLRSISRRVTAANIAMRPDWDDDGEISDAEKWLMESEDRPERWQLRVRDTPYLLQLASECPSDVSLNLGRNCWYGVEPGFNSTTNSGPFSLEMNTLQSVYVDTSAGAGDVALAYTLGVSATETNLVDVLQVHVVDTTVEEKWIPAGMNSIVSYDYLDVDGDVYWDVWRETEDGGEYIDGGYGSYFTLQGLEAGDYHVEVHFDDICEGGSWGYTSIGDLHVVDVRLSRLYETANPANFIFNPTPKDDYTESSVREEVIEDGLLRTYGVPRNNLYVVARTNENVIGVTVKLNVTPSNSADRVICVAHYNGNLADVCAQCSNGVAQLEISIAENSIVSNCAINVGLDIDGDGLLTYEESVPLEVYRSGDIPKFANIVGISRGLSASHDDFISDVSEGITGSGVALVMPLTRSLLSMFYEGGASDVDATYRSDVARQVQIDARSDGVGFSEWLTHNAGAIYSSKFVATIFEYEWGPESAFAHRLSECAPFTPWVETIIGTGQSVQINYMPTAMGRAVVSNFNAVVRNLAAERLQDCPNGTVAVFSRTNGWDDAQLIDEVFKSMSPTNVIGRTVSIGSRGGYEDTILSVAASAISSFADNGAALRDTDAFYAIGRGRITQPAFWISARKVGHIFSAPTYELYQVGVSCIVSDLYDFNFEDGALSRKAAILQLGYGSGASGREHGQIFRHQVRINAVYTNPEMY